MTLNTKYSIIKSQLIIINILTHFILIINYFSSKLFKHYKHKLIITKFQTTFTQTYLEIYFIFHTIQFIYLEKLHKLLTFSK